MFLFAFLFHGIKIDLKPILKDIESSNQYWMFDIVDTYSWNKYVET